MTLLESLIELFVLLSFSTVLTPIQTIQNILLDNQLQPADSFRESEGLLGLFI